jgi:hypothetical protein
MLFRSGDNLESGVIEFIHHKDEITLFTPYLKLEALKRINEERKIRQIVVRWEISDLCIGVSDPELYDYCNEHNIHLLRNTRIHLKTFWNNKDSVYLGSANVSNIGLGSVGSFNYELNAIQDNISFDDKAYLNEILMKSEHITEKLFDEIMLRVNSVELPVMEFPELRTPAPTIDYFLISQLPMTSTPELLYNIYSEKIKASEIEINCAAHDIALYEIPKDLNEKLFQKHLKTKFNQHPFIAQFKEDVKNYKDHRGNTDRDASMNFGRVKEWFADNTTTVPVPRRYELTEYVSLLYHWIVFFDDHFKWHRPGHSQIIFFVP